MCNKEFFCTFLVRKVVGRIKSIVCLSPAWRLISGQLTTMWRRTCHLEEILPSKVSQKAAANSGYESTQVQIFLLKHTDNLYMESLYVGKANGHGCDEAMQSKYYIIDGYLYCIHVFPVSTRISCEYTYLLLFGLVILFFCKSRNLMLASLCFCFHCVRVV